MELERTYTRIGAYRLHAVHHGAGPPVILLHGLSGSHRWWRFTLPALTRRYRVHAPELVGFGASRPATRQPSIPEMAEVLREWQTTRGIGPAHWVGHSMGGQIAIHVASRWPRLLERLVLVSAAGIPRRRSLPALARLISEVLPPRAWGRLQFLPTIALDAVRAGPRALVRAAIHLLSDDVRPLLPRITAPTLLIWGELDPLVPVEHGRRMAEAIADARLLVIPDAAHTPMADRPEHFNRAVLHFLRGET